MQMKSMLYWFTNGRGGHVGFLICIFSHFEEDISVDSSVLCSIFCADFFLHKSI